MDRSSRVSGSRPIIAIALGAQAEARASYDALMAAYSEMTVKKFKDAMVFSPRVLDRVGVQLLELGLPEG